MKVTVDIDTDDLIRQSLAEDYERLTKDIEDLKSRKDSLQPPNKQDLKDQKRWRKAVKTLIYYYYPYDEAEALLKGYKSVK